MNWSPIDEFRNDQETIARYTAYMKPDSEPAASHLETIAVQNERRWDRWAWLTLAAAILILLYPILLGIAAYNYPTDGWTIRTESITIAGGAWKMGENLSGRPSALQPDDAVLAIDGRPLTPDVLPPLPDNLGEGQVLKYTVQRGDAMLEVDVPLVKLTPAAIGRALRAKPGTIAVDIILLVLAGIAFFLRPGMAGPRYMLLAFAYLASTGLVTVYNLYHYTYPPVLTFFSEFHSPGWGWMLLPSLTLLFLVYPVRKQPLRRFPRLLPALLYGLLLVASTGAIIMIIRTRQPLPGATLLLWTNITAAFLFIATTITCVVHDYLTAREPVVRAQLRWLVLGFGSLVFTLLIFFIWSFLLGGSPLDDRFGGLFQYVLLLLPLSLTIGMLRYRLFDIDVIIRRTTQYVVVTGILLLVFFGLVIVLQYLFSRITGQSSTSAVVLSTLAIAVLFNPVRRRVQDVIDRRFFRRKYDAEKTLEAFAATVRNEPDLDALTAELLRVIQETMQPATLSIWLRDPATEARSAAVEKAQLQHSTNLKSEG